MLLCPYCQGTATPLSTLSAVSFIDFFQCEGCAKISERPKGAAGHPIRLLVGFSLQTPRAAQH